MMMKKAYAEFTDLLDKRHDNIWKDFSERFITYQTMFLGAASGTAKASLNLGKIGGSRVVNLTIVNPSIQREFQQKRVALLNDVAMIFHGISEKFKSLDHTLSLFSAWRTKFNQVSANN